MNTSAAPDHDLSGVAETLLLPLYVRAVETRRADALLTDQKAVALVAQMESAYARVKRIKMGEDDRVALILRNQKIIVGSAVCVAVIALLSGWYVYSHFNERKAQELFGYAISMTASNPAAGQAVAMMEIEKLREVVSKYPNTDAANLSRYTLGAV